MNDAEFKLTDDYKIGPLTINLNQSTSPSREILIEVGPAAPLGLT